MADHFYAPAGRGIQGMYEAIVYRYAQIHYQELCFNQGEYHWIFEVSLGSNVKCSLFVFLLGYLRFTTKETPKCVDSGTNFEFLAS